MISVSSIDVNVYMKYTFLGKKGQVCLEHCIHNSNLKGQFTQNKILASYTHTHVAPNLYQLLPSVKHNEDILKKIGNQTVAGSH